MSQKQNTPTVEELIQKAVAAGRMSAENKPRDTYKSTEKRLYALPILRDKLAADRERLQELKTYGLRERSTSLVRFQRSGVRLSPDDILDAAIVDMEATIAADAFEISCIERALKAVENDTYYFVIVGRYIKNLTDEQVAEKITCETTTVWRNRKRLVQTIAVRLYGAQAIN